MAAGEKRGGGEATMTRQDKQRIFSLSGTNNVRVPYTAWGYQYASQTDGAIIPAPPG